MYLKLTVGSPLEEFVRAAWPEAEGESLMYDYEDVYEWGWLELPGLGIRLNISREHGEAEEPACEPGPVYVGAFDIDSETYVDELPEQVVERFRAAHSGQMTVHPGRYYVDQPDAEPVRVFLKRD